MNFRICSLLLALGSVNPFARGSSTITSDCVEARSNHAYTCGRIFSGEQVTDGRDAILAKETKEGSIRGTRPAGLKIAEIRVGDASVSLKAPRRSIIYLHADSAEQRHAAIDRIQLAGDETENAS